MKIRALSAVGVLAVVAALTMSACSSAQPNPTPTATHKGPSSAAATQAALVKQAKAEGSVNWYSADGDGVNVPEAAAFTKKYGIQVNTLRLTVGPLEERLASEIQTNVHTADVLTVADTVVFAQSADWFVPLNNTSVPGWNDYPAIGKAKNYVLLRDFPAAITYNTNLVPKKDVPTSWKDLLKPFWKGHLLLSDPRQTPSYMGWAKVLQKDYGDKFLQQLAGQNLQVVASATPGAQAVAAGSAFAVFPSRVTNSSDLVAQGAPLKIVTLPGSGADIVSGELETAPHPAAAELFMQFQMSKEGVEAVCATNQLNSFYPAGEVAHCGALEKNWKLPDFTVTASQQSKLLGDLKLAG